MSRSTMMRIASFWASSSGSAMAESSPAAMSITRKVRLIRLRFSCGTPLDTLDRPTTVMGGGSLRALNMRIAFRSSTACSCIPLTVSTNGSRYTFSMGTPSSMALGKRTSMTNCTRPSAVAGMVFPMARAMILEPYFAARGMVTSNRSGSAEVELIRASMPNS